MTVNTFLYCRSRLMLHFPEKIRTFPFYVLKKDHPSLFSLVFSVCMKNYQKNIKICRKRNFQKIIFSYLVITPKYWSYTHVTFTKY